MIAIIDLDRVENDLNKRLINSPPSSIKLQELLADSVKEFVMQYVTIKKESEVK